MILDLFIIERSRNEYQGNAISVPSVLYKVFNSGEISVDCDVYFSFTVLGITVNLLYHS